MIKGRGVCRVLFWTLMSTVLKECVGNYSGFHGFVGCEIDPSVCNRHETCVYDCLFGSCQSPYDALYDEYCYDLSELQLLSLRGELTRLKTSGFSWKDLYTQCIVGNILVSYRSGLPYDSSFCESNAIRQEIEDQISDDAIRLLEKYLLDYDDDPSPLPQDPEMVPYSDDVIDYPLAAEEDPHLQYNRLNEPVDFYPPVDKKDEFVQVHKYLKSHKRNPYYSGVYDNYGEDYRDMAPREEEPAAPPPDPYGSEFGNYDELLEGLSLNDLQYLYDYLTQDTKVPEEDYDYVTDYPGEEITYDVNTPIKDVMAEDDFVRPDDTVTNMENENGLINDPAFLKMSPEDANLLSDLLEEKLSVSDLSQEEIERLYQYIESLIGEIEADIAYQEPESSQAEMDKFELESNGLENQESVEKIDGQKRGGGEEVDVEDESEIQPHIEPYIQPDKKTEEGSVVRPDDDGEMDRPESIEDFDRHTDRPVTSRQQFGIIQSDMAWLEVKGDENKGKMSNPEAVAFLRELEKEMGIKERALQLEKVGEKEITFHIDRDLTAYNGTYVADFALKHSMKLYNNTGVHVLNGGVLGDGEDRVSVAAIHHKPGKYFVLTFILCGAVAGIVLAVIIIYFIRRHGQQRWKLQQISKSGDGELGETATKDYQDLCRQRMQSKTSDKPEPVHSAGRVGPGADIPPRSTHSSRSSTSSW